MPQIYDNSEAEKTLKHALHQDMHNALALDACIGYFNLRGWDHLRELVGALQGMAGRPHCRVLIGMQRPLDEEILDHYRFRPSEAFDKKPVFDRTLQDFKRQLIIGAPTEHDMNNLRDLRDQLRSGQVEIKLFLGYQLHAKLYLVHSSEQKSPILGLVGSSNLTSAGLVKNGELNVELLDKPEGQQLLGWFEDRWNDEANAIDVSKDLAAILEESWIRGEVDPYLVYLKMAYHLSRDARAGFSEFSIPFGFQLFDYQIAAVKIAAHHLDKRGGVLIGDVVGLGKTVMATAVARVMQDDHRHRTLILCPKNLESMWKEYVHQYGLTARVLPLSKAIAELPDTPLYETVIIDESHNLKNPAGAVYRAVKEYLSRNRSRCILLTATPYNKDFLDLGAQLALFVDDETSMGMRPDAYISEIGELQFSAKHQSDPRTFKAFMHSNKPEDWVRLMRRYMVRRTRGFITSNYALTDNSSGKERKYLESADGTTRFYFPTRTPKTISFEFDADGSDPYPRLFSEEVVERINNLNLPRYGLKNYVLTHPARPFTDAEQAQIDGLSRAGIRLKGFCRTNLFKRLESSGSAFLQSVERHILRNYVFLYAIKEGLPIPIGATNEQLFDTRVIDRDPSATASVDDLVADEDASDESESDATGWRTRTRTTKEWERAAVVAYDKYDFSNFKLNWLGTDVFDPQLAKDLKADCKALEEILKFAGEWDPAKDAKLNRLTQLIKKDHPKDKILIFSQFADTVAYLDEQLKARGITALEGVTAGSRNPAELAWRFSPKSNQKEALAKKQGELRVLVATDVLSEGQNLQDGHIIVNYDLPWAIIRLIQRAGRVDRIGQHHDEVLCYSFLPARGIEEIIKLRSRLRKRLQDNGEVVGSDEVFFDDDTSTDKTILDVYSEKSGIYDEVVDALGIDPVSEAYQIWKNAIDADPSLKAKVEALPDVVFTARDYAPEKGKPEGVLVYVRDPDGNDELRWVAKDGGIVMEAPLEVLRAAACHPDTAAIPRARYHHLLVKESVQQLLTEMNRGSTALGRPSSARYRTYERLKAYIAANRSKTVPMFDSNLERLDIELVSSAFTEIGRRPLTTYAVDSLNALMKTGATDEQLAREVLRLREAGRLTSQDANPDAAEPQIVCSMGLHPNTD